MYKANQQTALVVAESFAQMDQRFMELHTCLMCNKPTNIGDFVVVCQVKQDRAKSLGDMHKSPCVTCRQCALKEEHVGPRVDDSGNKKCLCCPLTLRRIRELHEQEGANRSTQRLQAGVRDNVCVAHFQAPAHAPQLNAMERQWISAKEAATADRQQKERDVLKIEHAMKKLKESKQSNLEINYNAYDPNADGNEEDDHEEDKADNVSVPPEAAQVEEVVHEGGLGGGRVSQDENNQGNGNEKFDEEDYEEESEASDVDDNVELRYLVARKAQNNGISVSSTVDSVPLSTENLTTSQSDAEGNDASVDVNKNNNGYVDDNDNETERQLAEQMEHRDGDTGNENQDNDAPVSSKSKKKQTKRGNSSKSSKRKRDNNEDHEECDDDNDARTFVPPHGQKIKFKQFLKERNVSDTHSADYKQAVYDFRIGLQDAANNSVIQKRTTKEKAALVDDLEAQVSDLRNDNDNLRTEKTTTLKQHIQIAKETMKVLAHFGVDNDEIAKFMEGQVDANYIIDLYPSATDVGCETAD
jgi:hypothetical protein